MYSGIKKNTPEIDKPLLEILVHATIDSQIPYKRFLVNNALIMQWERTSDVTDAMRCDATR